ncbi:MAG TPA: thiolase family protein [Acidimicrobiia bacterium]|nr:thiolase family protein [Acidimicrobiia bacterium]
MPGAADWGYASDLDDVRGQVAIAGIGETAYTKASGRTAREIGAEAAERAIADAGLQPADIDGITWSGAFADFDVAAFHEHFGTSHEMWTSPWGGGMAWAATAPYIAAQAIRTRKARHVLNVFPVAWATQRSSMTGGPGEVHATQSLKQNLEVPFGWFPQPVYFASIMRRHMIEFGTLPEQFGAVAVACRRHANLHPGAVMHGRPMTIDDYLASPYLADPLRLLDSCLISDGGAAYVTTSVERARDLVARPAVVAGVGEGYSSSGTHWALQRAFTSTPQVFSAPGAFAMAGLTPADVDVLTVYDPFTVVSLMQIEDMGFCPKGEAGRFVEGDTLFHDAGKLPFNTHGGLLSHAYVLGIAHVVECVKQLRGVAAAQVPDCEVAVYGGYTGHMASTLVLTKDR